MKIYKIKPLYAFINSLIYIIIAAFLTVYINYMKANYFDKALIIFVWLGFVYGLFIQFTLRLYINSQGFWIGNSIFKYKNGLFWNEIKNVVYERKKLNKYNIINNKKVCFYSFQEEFLPILKVWNDYEKIILSTYKHLETQKKCEFSESFLELIHSLEKRGYQVL